MALPAGPKRDPNGHIPRELDALAFCEWWGGAPYAWQRPLLAKYAAASRPRVSYVQVGRKNGKSFLAAALAIDEMVRMGGQVFLISDSERNLKSALFHELNTLVSRSQRLSNCVLTYKDHFECPASGGRISLRPNNLSASQSINPDLVIVDEVHMQKTDSIWNGMLLAGAAAPRGLTLGITTPGYDPTSLANGLYEQVRAGSLDGTIFEPDNPACALDDMAAIVQANPVLADRPDMAAVFEFERGHMPEHDYRRFRLGQWTTTAEAWLPYGAWAGRTRPQEFEPGERIWVGFDGSYSGDSTALVACNDSGHLKVLGLWENPGRKGWRVPREQVNAAVHQLMADYDATLYCDPPYWAAEIAEWDNLFPGRVVEFPTFSRARMAPACTAFYSGVMDGRLTHDGDAAFARHVGNAQVKATPQGDVIVRLGTSKIDLAVAGCIAFSQAVVAPPQFEVGCFTG